MEPGAVYLGGPLDTCAAFLTSAECAQLTADYRPEPIDVGEASFVIGIVVVGFMLLLSILDGMTR